MKMKVARKKYSHIIWDWNGTLLNDVEWCIKVMNQLLVQRSLPPISDVSAYYEVFCFPIIKYYKNLKFDFEKNPLKN